MEPKLLVELIINITAIVTLGALLWKVITEFFKDRKKNHVSDIQALVSDTIKAELKPLTDKIAELNSNREADRTFFTNNLIEIFKKYK
jgi:hypothetical protein